MASNGWPPDADRFDPDRLAARDRFSGRDKFSGRDWLWVLSLTLAAGLLYGLALGDVPLRDWDEGTRALVAREIAETNHWLHPTAFGQPYMLKPPLMDWLVALSFRAFGINEWAARLPGAIASALGIPLVFALGRALFEQRSTALLSAATFLTLLPVARHGRLLMLDGMSVTAFLLVLLCVARSVRRRGDHWAIGIGIGLGWLGLTKGLLAVPLGAIAAAWMMWLAIRQNRSVPHLRKPYLRNPWLYLGLGMGLGVLSAWYGAQFDRYGSAFWQTHFLSQGLNRVSDSVEQHAGPPWYYLLELLKYGWPLLVMWPLGLRLAWQEWRSTWGSLVVLGTVGYLGLISVMGTKLPWYIMPVYPFIALAIGRAMDWMWRNSAKLGRGWGISFTVLGAAAVAGTVYLSVDGGGQPWLPLMGIVLCLTFAVTARLLWQRRRSFIYIFLTGTYVSLLLLMVSGEWLWELNEAFEVKPVAGMLRSHVSPNAVIYTSFSYGRPSLNFYCHCQVLPANRAQLRQKWADELVLVDRELWPKFEEAGALELDRTDEFVLVAPKLSGAGIS
ncbi:MAG: glycosyltransferase family 39 protein [Cyanobacteria bacterium P01_A01_bin.3]